LSSLDLFCRTDFISALTHLWGSDSFPLQDEGYESGMRRARSSSTPARPYIWR
jgi:hypothetical protein